jgi:hypothetical protein
MGHYDVTVLGQTGEVYDTAFLHYLRSLFVLAMNLFLFQCENNELLSADFLNVILPSKQPNC